MKHLKTLLLVLTLAVSTGAHGDGDHDHGPGAFVPVSASKLKQTTTTGDVVVRGNLQSEQPNGLEKRIANLERVVAILLQDRQRNEITFNTMSNLLIEVSKLKGEVRSVPLIELTTDVQWPLGTLHLNDSKYLIIETLKDEE